MGRAGSYFGYSYLAILVGLPIGCLAGGVATSLFALLAEWRSLSHVPEAFGLSLIIALVALLVGIFPALLYGAPVYALLAILRKASYVSVIIAGVLPGLALLLFDEDAWTVVVLFGACVAVATHWFAKHRMARLDAPRAAPSAPTDVTVPHSG